MPYTGSREWRWSCIGFIKIWRDRLNRENTEKMDRDFFEGIFA